MTPRDRTYLLEKFYRCLTGRASSSRLHHVVYFDRIVYLEDLIKTALECKYAMDQHGNHMKFT